MEEVTKAFTTLLVEVRQACQQLAIEAKEQELTQLQARSQDTDFWQDQQAAQAIMKQQAKLSALVSPWRELEKLLADSLELAQLDDESVRTDLTESLKQAESRFAALKKDLQFSGPYDSNDIIVSIYAGAGGTDAQDWAAMLLRMYVRWAEQHDCTVETIEQSAGEEAGIKSVTLELSGSYVYGKLKGEHGVHRLVRLSPFNSDNLRQTSFAKVDILPKVDAPEDLLIDEKDLKIDVYRAGGHGGQSVNTTDSAVRVTHLPTGLVVAIQNERSQLQNKETAMTILRSKLAQLQIEQHKEHLSELKGPNQSAEWGNQIRSYVLHPYKQVKDLRTRHESSDPDKVLDGDLDAFITAYLEFTMTSDKAV
jgi:peptide chain release factor 2